MGAVVESVSFAIFLLLPLTSGAASITYKIRKGDTLWALSRKHHISLEQLAQANGLSQKANLRMGEYLRIPTPGQTTTAKPKAASPSGVSTGVSRGGSYLVHTQSSGVCLRAKPTTSAPKKALLPQGMTAKLLARTGNWAKVALGDGTCGFIYRPLLAPGPGSLHCSAAAGSPAGGPEASDEESSLVQTALALRGSRYRSAGTSRGGFDCSGFTRYVFAKYGVSLPHSSAAQAGLGKPVSRAELRPGDLVFFHTYRSGISHVGIYIGDGRFVHAARHGRGVTVDSLNSAYYAPRYRGARRVR